MPRFSHSTITFLAAALVGGRTTSKLRAMPTAGIYSLMPKQFPAIFSGKHPPLIAPFMKPLLPVFLLCAAGLLSLRAADPVPGAGSFKGVTGLQLYSLRVPFKADLTGTLDKVKALGFVEVETAGTYGQTPEKLHDLLEAHGLKAISGHFPYGDLVKNVDAAVATARSLKLAYVAVPGFPHHESLANEEEVRRAAADFNHWGEVFKRAGIQFTYHPHGFEFGHREDGGTMFDLLARETNPEFVNFEMDVWWVVQPGQDPVKLLRKYPTRFPLMHLKEGNLALGTGRIDWPALLTAAASVGVKHYFIEDESPNVESNLPISIRYLDGLR